MVATPPVPTCNQSKGHLEAGPPGEAVAYLLLLPSLNRKSVRFGSECVFLSLSFCFLSTPVNVKYLIFQSCFFV